MLCSVSRALGYRSVKTFVSSHLNYLVAEWLAQRQSDDRYTLGSFPYSLLDHDTIQEFYKWENKLIFASLSHISFCYSYIKLVFFEIKCIRTEHPFPIPLKLFLPSADPPPGLPGWLWAGEVYRQVSWQRLEALTGRLFPKDHGQHFAILCTAGPGLAGCTAEREG